MPVILGNVVTNATAMLNASGDPRWPSGVISDAVLEADGQVCSAIFKNKSNMRNQLFYAQQIGLANGGTVGQNVAGPIAFVEFVVTGGDNPGTRPGVEWERAEIQRENINPLNLDFDCHYYLDGSSIWHNAAGIASAEAATISVNCTFPAFVQSSACQAPSEYAYLVLCGAMSLLVDVEGEAVGPHGTWAQQFAAGLQMISAGEGNVPLAPAA